MTITAQTNRYSYSGNGVTTDFAYNSRFLADADLVVVSVDDATGVETVLTLTTDYTLSGAGDANGGTVTMLTAPASGTTLVIYSDPAVTQLVDHINNDNFDVNATVEAPLDKLTLICRRIKELITRGLRQPESDTAAIGTLPTLAARKGNFLYFNATTGDPEAAAGTTETPVSAFMATVLDDADAAAARATLGAVGLTGNETVAGVKTFSSKPVLPATTPSGNEAASAAHVAATAKSLINGLTYSNGTDATNDIDVAVGGAMSDDGTYFMTLGSAITKRIDAAWAVGTGNGGLMSAAALTNQVYGIWLIARSDTGVVDVGFDASLTAPTLPADYDKQRLIGWIQRVGGSLRAVTVTETGGGGIRMQHTTPPLDVDSTALTTSRLLSTLASAPIGIKTIASIRVLLADVGGGLVIVCSPDETDAAPSGTASPGYTVNVAAGVGNGAQIAVTTNTSGQIAARATAAIDNYRVTVIGYEWGRR
jgi:hypothetical protein